MVRYLKNWTEKIDDQNALDRFVAVELLLARLHFPISVCFALGVLAQTGLVPYIAPHEWRLVLVASFFLTLANGRDLNHCIRHFYQIQSSEDDFSQSLLDLDAKDEVSSAWGQMQMLAAFSLTLGSVSLLNSSIIALIRDNAVSQVVSRRQYAASFALFLIGSGANGVLSSGRTQSLESFRILISFQNLLASATLCTASVLLLPDIGVEESMSPFQTSLLTILSSVGCIMLVMSSIVNYFHTLGYCTLHYEGYNLLLERRKSQIGKSKRMAAWETVKGLLWARKGTWWKRRKSNRKRARYAISNTSLEHSIDEENQADDEGGSESSNYSSSMTSRSTSSESFSTIYDEEAGSRTSFASGDSQDEEPNETRERKRGDP